MEEEKKKKSLLSRVLDAVSSRDEKAELEEAKKQLAEAQAKAKEMEEKAEAEAAAEARNKAYQARAAYYERRAKVMQKVNQKKHVVEAGDTLGGLSLKYYGSAIEDYWKFIYEANEDQIGDDPNKIVVGMELIIPEIPEDMKK